MVKSKKLNYYPMQWSRICDEHNYKILDDVKPSENLSTVKIYTTSAYICFLHQFLVSAYRLSKKQCREFSSFVDFIHPGIVHILLFLVLFKRKHTQGTDIQMSTSNVEHHIIVLRECTRQRGEHIMWYDILAVRSVVQMKLPYSDNGFIYKWSIIANHEQIYQVGCHVRLGYEFPVCRDQIDVN